MKKVIIFLVVVGVVAVLFNILKIVAGIALLIIGAVALLLAIILGLVNMARTGEKD